VINNGFYKVMIMANTDNTQAQMTTDNSNPAESFLTSSKISAATSLTNKSKVKKADAPLMRYFNLADEADYSYVLGYN
jgi:hypothetical protein